jgi:BolA family transcriptional regulator, general stress-responsive regulator
MISILDEIQRRLACLQAHDIQLRDDSASHAGHAGNQGGGHFELVIVSPVFAGKRAVERHRMVYTLLADLIPAQIHALSIRAMTPDEF